MLQLISAELLPVLRSESQAKAEVHPTASPPAKVAQSQPAQVFSIVSLSSCVIVPLGLALTVHENISWQKVTGCRCTTIFCNTYMYVCIRIQLKSVNAYTYFSGLSKFQ